MMLVSLYSTQQRRLYSERYGQVSQNEQCLHLRLLGSTEVCVTGFLSLGGSVLTSCRLFHRFISQALDIQAIKVLT